MAKINKYARKGSVEFKKFIAHFRTKKLFFLLKSYHCEIQNHLWCLNWRKRGEFAPEFQMLCKKFSLAFLHTYSWYLQKVAPNYFFDHNHSCSSLNISASHVLYRIQAFAKFKRPKCTRLRTSITKIFPEMQALETPQKRAPFAVLMGAIAPILPLARCYWTHSYYLVVGRKQSLRVFIFTFLKLLKL